MKKDRKTKIFKFRITEDMSKLISNFKNHGFKSKSELVEHSILTFLTNK